MRFKKIFLVLMLLAAAFSPLSVEAETFIKGVYTLNYRCINLNLMGRRLR